jgi:hypothetical protein
MYMPGDRIAYRGLDGETHLGRVTESYYSPSRRECLVRVDGKHWVVMAEDGPEPTPVPSSGAPS